MRNLSKPIGIAIILIQVFDIAIHLATNQVELLRLASSALIIIWVVAVLAGWLTAGLRNISLGAIGVYLLFNLIFLAQNGLTNAHQDNAPRTMLFILVIATTVLSIRFMRSTDA